MSVPGPFGEFVESLVRWDRLGGRVAYRDYLPPRPARFGEPSAPLPPQVRSVLERLGVEGLYSHQAEALDLIRSGRDVAVVTPTASGKSLVFYLPTIEAILREQVSRALYLFPYKALEQDQLQSLRELGQGLFSGVDLSSEIYDGDTPPAHRRRIKASPPDVLITNPDMLHLGILASHAEWRVFFERLRFVVVDELHVYRGVFGSHLAHVLRRLWRVCERYGSRPALIACSATVGNPSEFAEALTGRPAAIVSESGAPRAGRHFLFINPEGSPYTVAMNVLARCVREGYKTIAFTKARKITELIHSWLAQAHPELRGRVASYRAGYLPEERREIEKRLFQGDLWGVVSTSALELGIDVGGLDVCVLAGYPGSIMSSWQRIGRVGRKGRDSLTVLVALPDALDQYFMRLPREFFERPFEQAVLDPANRVIASAHLVCAGAEVPLGPEDRSRYPGGETLIDDLLEEGRLVRDASGERIFSLRRRPHREVSLRSTGQSFAIVDSRAGRTIGSIDGVRVFHECHEEAIYLHAGTQYRVLRLDTDARRVEAVPCEVDYYTQAVGEKETEILETWSLAERGAYRLGLGRLKVTVRLSGYERRRIFGQDLLSRHPMEFPPIVFETVGFWLVLPESLDRQITRLERHFMGALHAAEHAMISLFPLLALCDRSDVGGISYSLNAQVSAPTIFIYDGYPGGIGLAAHVHDRIGDLLARTSELLEGCPCEDGCPSCIQSPKCGSGNRPLDKAAARIALAVLTGRMALAEPPGGPEGRAGPEAPQAPGPAQPRADGPARLPEPAREFEDGGVPAGRGAGHSLTTERAHPTGGEEGGRQEARRFPRIRGRSRQSLPGAPGGWEEAGTGARACAGNRAEARGRAGAHAGADAGAETHLPDTWEPDTDAATLPSAVELRPGDGRLLVFDLETQRGAEEVGGWDKIRAMGLALAVVFEPARGEFRTYLEKDVERLLLDLLTADKVVGFNINRFDIPVLEPYTPHDLSRIRTLDMLDVIYRRLGFRVSLGHLAEANLGASKTADGLQALRWYREGRMDLIERYCRADVALTARVFFLGRRQGYLLFRDSQQGMIRVPVDW